MDYWHSLTSNIRYFYNNMNSATLSGAIDVIVVEQPDGSLLSTPFHVRFGKYGVFNSNEKYVDIMINNEEIKGLKMKLAENGVAYFVQETDENEVPEYLASSPPPSLPVAVDSAIEENIRKLKKQQRKESRIDYEKKRNAAGGGSISRSPSPSSRISKSTTLTEVDIIPETPPSTPQISTLDQKAKMKLPFSSSIFSNRRYRSLPDLSNISASLEHGQQSNQTFHKGHSRKMTVGYISPKETDSIKVLPIPVSPSRSRSSPKFVPPKSPIGEFLIPESKSSSEIDGVRTEPATPMKSVNFVPTDDSDSDGSTVKPKESTTSTIARKPSSAALDMIADGALSDSEVDRTRMTAGTPSDTVWKWGEFPESSKQQKKKETQPAKSSDSYWSWFSWGRSTQPPEEEKGIYLGDLVGKEHDPKDYEKYFGKHSASSTVSSVADSGTGHSVPSPSALSVESLNSDGTDIPTPTPREIKRALEENEAINQEMIAGTDENSKKPKTKIGVEVKEKARQKSGNSVTSTSEQSGLSDDETMQMPMKRTKHIRSLRLSNEELKALQLQHGSNEARFSITTKFQGTSWCACHIYLFKYSEKIVISDIDGTITKSDVLGHVIAAIGGQWAHVGVAELYTRIKENGYKMVYLSSRAIGQSHYTKTYLQSLAQGSRTLPDGPVLLSPTSVLMAFRKEVIERKPEEFKIACLSDLKALFPVKQPFYAGFGNRDTDVKSYVSVDIPPERILIINPSGAVRRADHIGFVSSYATMAMETVDYLFPPIHSTVRKSSYDGEFLDVPEKMSTNFTKPETCSTFTFWQTAPEQVVKVDDELEAYERKRKEMADKNKKAAKKKK